MVDEVDPALTGAAFDLANAGYRSMPDKETKQEAEAIGGDSASLRQVAEERAESHNETVVRKYTGPGGEVAASDEAVTLARAARDYAGALAAENLIAQNLTSEQLAVEVDALRAQAAANDPDAADFYGFDPPEAVSEAVGQADTENGGSPKNAAADRPDDLLAAGLDPELDKALMHPQVLQAIEQKVGEAERSRQSYREGLEAAMQIAQSSFLSQFPEFAGMAPENIPGALELISRQDPGKLARIQGMVATTQQLLARREQENGRQAEIERQHFLKFADAEDARLETMLKGEPQETQRAVLTEIVASAKESGIEPAELNRLFNTEPLMRNAIFQRMMYDAGKYRLMMKAKNAALARPVPPVQRPGMATTRSERERADVRALSAKLSSSGDIKDAVALYRARTSGSRS
ncbi:hypothetical protein [Bradyrhizobium sp. Tv2a-2]|uniref:hypothetical protein n=1 Tax=Bradyrhizobium sp. Tv2a-2 TaxID=113395 RepID=UPI000401865C|nr:hypothetical protein [Bradyrhizobium sp. Tv2a-2]